MRELVRQKIIDSLAASPPEFTRRDVYVPRIGGKAIAVIGPRRAGKTTFLWQMVAERVKAGRPREAFLYFNFEDERLATMTTGDLNLIVEEYFRLHPELRDREQVTFLLDEIQTVPGWEAFTRRLLDTEKIALFVSGSSARMLSREVASNMRGRAMEALVLPFGFREYLRHRHIEPGSAAGTWPKSVRSGMDKALLEYLETGGYPEAQETVVRDRLELLRGYVDTAMLRDVIERHAVSHPVALRWMIRQVLGAAGGMFSINRLYSDLRAQSIPVAKDTLYAYFRHIEDAFLLFSVPVATESERRRMINPRKVYPVDPGLITVFDRSGRMNLGHRLETAVALELIRRGAELAYVRTADNLEVDFLARFPEGREALIQVCAQCDAQETRDREVRTLLAAAEEHPRASMHLVTLATDGLPELPANITLHGASDWLFGQD